MSAIGQHRARTSALASQHGIGISCRAVRLVSAFLTMKVHRGVRSFATSSGWWLLIVFNAPEALLSCPCFQQSSIHSEVLIREQIALACLFEHGGEESVGNVAFHQALAVLREHRGIPNRVLHVQTDKPTE